MLLSLATQSDVPLKEVRVPDYLFWYMGVVVALCLVVFLIIPAVLTIKRRSNKAKQDQPSPKEPS
jgi:heme/copper-type cytochrome/quinol oxidase subunit 2